MLLSWSFRCIETIASEPVHSLQERLSGSSYVSLTRHAEPNATFHG